MDRDTLFRGVSSELYESGNGLQPKASVPFSYGARHGEATYGANCEYRFDGKNLFIKPLSAHRRRQVAAMEEHSRKLERRLPANMHFDNTPLKEVLDTIARSSGLKLRPWKDEGSRKVTIDVGGNTVKEALEAVVRQIDGERVVMIRTWAGSWGQYRLVDKPGES